jgi:hypothetical protein
VPKSVQHYLDMADLEKCVRDEKAVGDDDDSDRLNDVELQSDVK